GRNHYPICFTTVLAGGGVKRGYVHGSSGSKGDRPSKPVTVPDFHATIGWAAGLPLKDPAYSPSGRPFYIGGERATPVTDVFA
ncbi:MAG: DUF1501 domain-containing protein, partial [Verrucomicrobiota bacterium]